MMVPGAPNPLLWGGDPCEGYTIDHSVRFNTPDAAYLSRTPGVAGNRKTWTWSGWVKRAALGSDQYLTEGFSSDGSRSFLRFGPENQLHYANATLSEQVTTSQVFRDVAAWMHILLAVDTTQATASDRVKLYINGQQVGAFLVANYPALNSDSWVNAATLHSIGRSNYSAGSGSQYLAGYLSDIHFVDGQALGPADFGFFCQATGQWRPKAYAGTYGSNGFHLDFSDGSAATAAALGADRSGNGNNWTPTNISVAAGAGCDWLEDSPTNNFCTLNPLNAVTSTATLANGALDATTGSTGVLTKPGTIPMAAGKWYWEVTPTAGTQWYIGIIPVGYSVDGQVGLGAGGYSYANNAVSWENGVNAAYGATYTTGDTIGVALDLDAGTLTFYKNGVSQGQAFSGITGEFVAIASDSSGDASCSYTFNFGQRAFASSAPAGFKPLSTKNITAPTIKLPSQHMTAKLDAGANIKATAEAVYPSLLEWIKDRANANNHQLVDSVRGAAAVLQSNTAAAEAAYAAPAGSSVAWLWRAGGAAVANNAGSIASQVSVNAAAGFSVVSYAGTGANATIGHGLGVAPKLILVKDRAAGNWAVLHGELANTEYLLLNSTSAKAAGAAYWNSASPSSGVFSVGTAADVNAVGHNYIAYCFTEVPGYSKFGKYTGNGSADGTFVHCGFRPAFVLLKRVDSGANWYSFDTARDTYNLVGKRLFPSSTNAEIYAATDAIDVVSNGFKLRTDNLDTNVSGGTYIFTAFAEFPFKYANAR